MSTPDSSLVRINILFGTVYLLPSGVEDYIFLDAIG